MVAKMRPISAEVEFPYTVALLLSNDFDVLKRYWRRSKPVYRVRQIIKEEHNVTSNTIDNERW